MKRFKILISFLSLCLIFVLNVSNTYSYFVNQASTEAVSFTLGNINIAADDNRWEYRPVDCWNSSYNKNDLVKESELSSDLAVKTLRPGDAFEKIVTITSTGALTSKIRISKSDFTNNSVYTFNIKPADETSKARLVEAGNGSYTAENVNPGEAFKIRLRLEVPIAIDYELIEKNSLKKKLSNNPMDLLAITATQYNNPAWNEN